MTECDHDRDEQERAHHPDDEIQLKHCVWGCCGENTVYGRAFLLPYKTGCSPGQSMSWKWQVFLMFCTLTVQFKHITD